jgi:hypothetical protein
MANNTNISTRKFCGVDLDVTEFEKTFPYRQPGTQDHWVYSAFNTPNIKTEFVGFEWRYIGNEPDDSPVFNNKEVKATGTIAEDAEHIAYDFRTSGYDMSKFPAIVNQDGAFKNGRTRNLGSKINKQDWVPVAKFNFITENENLATISTSSKANSSIMHKTQHLNNMSDYEEQGVAAIQSGLPRDEQTLRNWYLTETNFKLDLDVANGILTKVINQVLLRTSVEFSLINQDIDRKNFIENFKLPVNFIGKCTLYKAKNVLKFFGDKELSSHGNPPPTILYTDAYSPELCGEMVHTFMEELEDWHKKTFLYVNNTQPLIINNEQINIVTPKFNTDFILGVIPNLDRGSQPQLLEQGSVISVKDYIKDSGFRTSKKK